MKEYYTIGELSKIYHLPVSTLRYYHRCGLFEPEVQDPSNGYRYYGRDQLYRLDALGLLRVLDIPVADIAGFSGEPDFDGAVYAYLKTHRSVLEEQLDVVQSKLSLLDAILAQEDKPILLNEAGEEIAVRHFPARTLLIAEVEHQPSDEREFRIYLQEQFGTPLTESELPTAIRGNGMSSSLNYLLQSGEIIYDGAYMEPVGKYGRGKWTVLELPERDWLTLRFSGGAAERRNAYALMADYVRAHAVEAEDTVLEEMLWRGIMPSKKGMDVMELRVMLK